ncbi:hypothetical protein RHMOL_Rhmol07G0209700 [Rhododendron molle]|uniref:Uncharacterized protein n=1 Tax=Rhododendron molle TaxID=49168 RepID=A0ACC0N4G5_RHOML|nr:hypothetical protein RHMOL_Rhmol07G0209700 [Rhododendron molle]
MADHGIGGGEGEVVDQSGDRGERMAVEPAEDRAAEAVVDRSAEVPSDGDGVEDHEQEAGAGKNRRAIEAEPRATVEASLVGPVVEPIGFSTEARASPGGGCRVPTGSDSGHNIEPRADHLDDVAEHAPDEILAKLLEDHPIIGEYVLKAKEDRARAIEASEAAVRAERERELGQKGWRWMWRLRRDKPRKHRGRW